MNKDYQFYFWILQSRRMISKFSILLILVALGTTLHTQHQQTTNLGNMTLPQLINEAQTLQQRAANNTELSSQITQPNELATFLQRVVKAELQDLYTFESTLLPVVALSPKTCADLTPADRAALVQKIECAQNNVQRLIQSIDQAQGASLRDDLLRRATLQYMYLEQVKLGLKKPC